MPWKKGHPKIPGEGRKGYEYEEKQLLRMRNIFNGGLTLIEKLLKGKPTMQERMRYEDLQKTILKIMDKLHANKEYLRVENPEQNEALKELSLAIKEIAKAKEENESADK